MADRAASAKVEAAEKRSTSKTCPALQFPEHCSPPRAAARSLHAEAIGDDISYRRSCEPAFLGRLTEPHAVLVSKGLLRFSLGTHSERDGIISYHAPHYLQNTQLNSILSALGSSPFKGSSRSTHSTAM